MQITFASGEAASISSPLLAVLAVDTSDPSTKPASATPNLLSASLSGSASLERALSSGEFRASVGETLLLHTPANLTAERLLLVGAGAASTVSANKLRQAAGSAVRFARERSIRSLSLLVPETALDPAAVVRAIAEGAILADFDPDLYRSDRKDRSILHLDLLLPSVVPSPAQDAALEVGRVLAESQNFARALVLEPGNILPPSELARRASAMAVEVGLACQVHSTEFLRQHGMNAFLAVAQGSAQPPALIHLSYEPANTPPEGAPLLALVGKGITFDTGGISIKPADGMEKMKYDMAGAAAMLGAMRAIALLKPAVRVLCIVCSAENMPSGTAYRPGDVVTAMSGTTIEVMNTDAEGRMVLADGLHYARTLGATHLIDAATLTGAVAVALGRLNAGMFSNDEETCARFTTAAESAGEAFWRLPCTDEYRDQIKSSIADIQNTGIDRWGGAITAAMFLKEFTAGTPWIHLDIAAMAWIDEARNYIGKGPSGVAVRSVVDWVRSYERR
ncbi:leucyl aminopeptidase [Terriglobus aquaticus]|uniref:Probable cytosol aminopeptidase n=1 Tax=Terriglobus aquaticus TaxID=940139 RepID=A0ABW9KJ61_9BACT|nr:leucyl aminopeptidase [Terriglobus aquaticus]